MRSDNPSWFGWPFARLWNRSAPNADKPVVIIGPDLSQPQPPNIDMAIVPRGNGSLSVAVPDAGVAGGNKRGNASVDLQLTRSLATQAATGIRAVIAGGADNTASGADSCIAGGSGNTSSGPYTFVAGVQNIASAGFATIAGGQSNTASGNTSVISGGQSNTASGVYSTIPGGFSATTRGLYGRFSYASGTPSSVGEAQFGMHILRRQTSSAALTQLTSDEGAVSATNIPVLPNTSAYIFRIQVLCIQVSSPGTVGDTKGWEITGLIKRGANAAATEIVGTPNITVIGADTSLGADNSTGAIIGVAADTTRGGLNVTANGANSGIMSWVATVHTTEVDY